MNLILFILVLVASRALVTTKANRLTRRNYDDDDSGNYLHTKVNHNNVFNGDDFVGLYNSPTKYLWGNDDFAFQGGLNTRHFRDDGTNYMRQRTRRRRKKKASKKGKNRI